jgi:hypothetical protein
MADVKSRPASPFRPPTSSVSQRPEMRLIVRKTRMRDEDDDAVAGPDINKSVGRIYPALVKGEPKWLWFLRTEPAPPPNSGTTGSLEEAAAQFKRRIRM